MSSIGLGPKELTRSESKIKPKKIPNLPNLDNIEKRFVESIDEIKNLFSVKGYSDSVIQDIHRSQLVFLYSTLDNYMHEIISYGILMIFFNYWDPTTAYNLQKVNMENVQRVCNVEKNNMADFVKEVKVMISNAMQYETMMRHDAIVNSLRGIGIPENDLSALDVDDIKEGLKSAFRRRNQIVHQSDRNTPSAFKRADFDDEKIVEKDIELVEKLQRLIHGIVKSYSDRNDNA